ncbi:Ig-like domain repeat protein [Granulicella aggregans]|uniref:Ig-like domain repeat protein n=1 Tax=Granulicella aggregans TaxID=474949 RepID=UPI0021E032F4|nr:Ig-like domain repeat protein [Granulicella aggregans]
MPFSSSLRLSFKSFRIVTLVLSLVSVVALGQTPAATPNRLAATFDETPQSVLKGSVPPQARTQNDQGEVKADLSMNRMLLLLKRSDAQESALKATIEQMHDPKSPQFHKWLTPAQFGAQYGPSDADIAVVVGWLKGHGFQVAGVAQGKGSIEFSGTVGQVNSTFHTAMHSYTVKGKQYVANATNPSIPQALTPVVRGILSLNNFVKTPHTILMGKREIVRDVNGNVSIKPDASLSNGQNAVGPGDLWNIYNSTPLITATTNKIDGTGQTIAIVGRSDVSTDDISGFRSLLLPAPYKSTLPLTQIVNGPDPGINGDDALEQALDVEYAGSMAPAAQIDLVVSGSTNTTDGVDLSVEYIVDNNLAPVMSTSYGNCEAGMGVAENQFYNQIWEQAAAQGITSMVSSGDNGSAGCDLVGPSGNNLAPYVADEGLEVSGLASTPYNVAVGGSEFSSDSSTYWSATPLTAPTTTTTALGYIPETVWNESCSPLVCGNANADIAAGSGGKSGCINPTLDAAGNITACSGGYAEPDWQAGIYGLPSDGARHLPDVSLNAAGHDGYIVCFGGSCDNGGVYIVGGTSASSPSFAGAMALVNQSTGSRQGQANYTLYRLAATEYGSASAPNTATLSSCNASNGNTTAASCIFHDVTAGTNAVPCDGGTLNCSSTTAGQYGVLSGYAAGTGYDNASGLGSVNIANLVAHWNDTTLTATTTALTLGATTSTFGQPVNLAVTVAPTSGSGTPTGSVALITDAATASGAGAVTLTNGAFNGTISSLPGGSYHVSAHYAGDTAFSPSSSGSAAVTVSPAASSTKLSFSASDSVTGAVFAGSIPYGSVVNAAATVTGVSGQTAPSGNVAFNNISSNNGSTLLATKISDATGGANYSSSGYAIGTYTWTASFAGNGNYNASVSPAAAFTVTPAATTLRLLSTTTFVIGTQSATLTAIVLDDSFLANPTGSITFKVNGKTLGTATLAAYSDPATGTSEAEATIALPATALAAGANSITATYTADSNYAASTSAAVSIGYSATAVTNAITLAASSSTLTVGEPVTLTATVTTGGIPSSAGTVTFFDGAVPLATVQVVGSTPAKGFTTGTAVLKTILGPGTHSIKTSYGGILAAPAAVASSAVSVTVTGATASTTVLTATPNATNATNYDLTATEIGHGLLAPSGSVDFAETTVADDFGTLSIDPSSAVHKLLPLAPAAAGQGLNAYASVLIDLNGDGILDIASVDANASRLLINLGNGDGTFQGATSYPVSAGAQFTDAITTGDFNGDGIVDIATTSQYNGSFSGGQIDIFLGNGDGTFQPSIGSAVPGFSINTAVADFNRDGILDVAAVQYYPMQVSVAFGNGDGTFASYANYPALYNDFSAYFIASGDFNGDGAPDLVEVNQADQSAEVFMNDGAGNFQPGVNLTTDLGPQSVVVADLNHDGKADVITSNYGAGTLGVFLGNGDGTFANQVSYPLQGVANALTIGDVNGDGKLDIAAAYYINNIKANAAAVGILNGNGDGTFGTETDYLTGQAHSLWVALGDVNGDGTVDVLSSNGSASDPTSQIFTTLLGVTQATVVQKNVAIAGPANSQQEVVATYSADPAYNASSSAGVFVKGSGTKSTPAISWRPTAAWGVGVALGSNVLNAVTTDNIPGSFAYTAQLGTGAAFTVTAVSTITVPGTYTFMTTFTPTDTSSYTTATASQSVSIVPADFALQASVPSLTIVAGKSGTFTVSAASLYGFSGQTTLTSGALPGGFAFAASPSSVAAGGTSTITIQTTGINAQASLEARPSLHGGIGAGVAFAGLLAMPLLVRRRRLLAGRLLMLLVGVALVLNATGCGEGYATNSNLALTTSAAKAASQSTVTLTATLSGGHSNVGGTVTFYNGDTILGSPVPVNGNTATLQIATLPVGLDSLTATYSGDRHNAGANSSAVPQLITGQTSIAVVGTSGSISHSTSVQITLQ